MGIEALTHDDLGREVVPTSPEDWNDWVSASRTRNHTLSDPILDWLELYGDSHGFERDTTLSTYDPRTDFTAFIFEQGRLFEDAVVGHLRTLAEVRAIASGPEDVRDLAKGEETFAAMRAGVPVIHQGVLRDPQHRTFGAPDLLVRSDVLHMLFPTAIDASDSCMAALGLGGPWHYRVVDIKFSTLNLLVNGTLDNSGSAAAYKIQVFVYNRALGRLQGYEPPESFLLGRGWTQREDRGSSCMDCLAPVPQAGTLAKKRPIAEAASEAIEWMRRVRAEGSTWSVLPTPSLPELYPNMSHDQDSPWHSAKRSIAEQLDEPSLLWQVAAPGRQKGHEAGVYRWKDPRLTPEIVGVTGETRSQVLDAILAVNRSSDGPVVRPSRISTAEDEWREPPPLEFYVDFETVSDLADDFSRIPEKGGQTLIFMIGCGHVEEGQWRFESFLVDALTEPEEAQMIDAWVEHMAATRSRLAADGDEPRLIHWSPAEVTNFETAYNAARKRHPEKNWPVLRWFDFLRKVMREEPVVIRGALAFGLKAVAKALHSHGLIETTWGDGPTDGLGAMIGAWWCQGEAARRGVPMARLDLMQEIARYNEVDCRVMMETVAYLRQHH
ncbi:MAG: hypothetical protein WEE64_04680 [Dehalococcoidia bacterium]